jgi:hypothetical protein
VAHEDRSIERECVHVFRACGVDLSDNLEYWLRVCSKVFDLASSRELGTLCLRFRRCLETNVSGVIEHQKTHVLL